MFNVKFKKVSGLDQGCGANWLISLWKNVQCIFLQLKEDVYFRTTFYDGNMFNLYVCKMFTMKWMKVSGLEQGCVANGWENVSNCLIRPWKNVQCIFVAAKRRFLVQSIFL